MKMIRLIYTLEETKILIFLRAGNSHNGTLVVAKHSIDE